MPGQSTKLQRDDEDTDLRVAVHRTNQMGDRPEMDQEEPNEPQNELNRQVSQKKGKVGQAGEKGNRGNRR
jgi:hypothetical protein